MIDQLEGKVVAEKYRVDSLIRETESGDLYFGRHIVMDKPVMLKILAPALAIDARFVKRFSDEARIASSIVHQTSSTSRISGRMPTASNTQFSKVLTAKH